MIPSPATCPRVGDLPEPVALARLAASGLPVRIGPFDFRLRIGVGAVRRHWLQLYRDYPLLDDARVLSCHADLQTVWNLRPLPRRCVRFSVDGMTAHEDLPFGQGLAVLEWGINLAIAMRFHGFLMLHAAVVERHGRALLLPAWPGHGKTTLAAALVHRGWRLFSDEFGLVRPGGKLMTPLPRPMPLKNQSIDIIRAFSPQAEFGPVIPNTRKGTIAHVKPPAASIARAAEGAPATWIVFPRWAADAPLALEEIGRGEGFMQLATNAFNYELLGEQGFSTVRDLVDTSRCFRLGYSELEQAVAALTDLADADAG